MIVRATGRLAEWADGAAFRFLSLSAAARSSRARARGLDVSRVLPSLKQTLERIDDLNPDAQDARRLMSTHLPGLIDRYVNVPAAYRSQRDGEDISVDERLIEGLQAVAPRLKEISEKLARSDVAALETQGRFIKSRYGQERIEG